MFKAIFAFFIVFSITVFSVSAEELGPEFYISNRGEVKITGVKVVSKTALNWLDMDIWGQKWSAIGDYDSKYESSDGVKVNLEDIKIGHNLEITGRLAKGKIGMVEIKLLKDVSLDRGSRPEEKKPIPVVSVQQENKKFLTKNLKIGHQGEEVKILQGFLQKNGWGIPSDGPVTGYFGKITANALKKFQKSKGLAVSGILDDKTKEVINTLLK